MPPVDTAESKRGGDGNDPRRMVERCVESISKNTHLRNRLKSGSEEAQRDILTAWYIGNTSATPNVEASLTVERFVTEALPEAKRVAA